MFIIKVGVNMEKDIINEFKDIVEESRTEDNTEYYIKLRNTLDLLENIIAINKELKQELDSVKEIYYTQKEIEKDYIPKSKVKELRDKYKKEIEKFENKRICDRQDLIDERIYRVYYKAYQKLLEEGDK